MSHLRAPIPSLLTKDVVPGEDILASSEASTSVLKRVVFCPYNGFSVVHWHFNSFLADITVSLSDEPLNLQ